MVGGAMLRSDYTFVQQESGGSYQNGKIRSLHRGLDLREAENIWCNEKDERADYNAWWYCCIPISGDPGKRDFHFRCFYIVMMWSTDCAAEENPYG